MNNISKADKRHTELSNIEKLEPTYAPLRGYDLGYLYGEDVAIPERQSAFVSTYGLSWRTHERYARTSYPIFTVVTTRLRLLVSARKSIVPKKNYEDKLKREIDHYKQLYEEFREEKKPKDRKIAVDAFLELKRRLPFLKDDLSNIYNCFDRQRREVRERRGSDVEYITNFLNRPNIHEDWSVLMTKTIWDYLVHLEAYIYKVPTFGRALGGRGKYSQLASLKAPTIAPVEGPHILSLRKYKQDVTYAYLGQAAPPVYFDYDELMRLQYLPTNSYIYSLSPIEAIFTLLNEQIYYDVQRTEEFSLGKPPMGILAIDGRLPGKPGDNAKPMGPDQLHRTESTLNKRSKISQVKILQGVNRSQFHYFSRPERDSLGIQRQEQILDIAAKVYNMTPQEVNLIKDVNRSTAGQQARSEALKGLEPHFKLISNEFYNDLFLPMGFGNYELKFENEIDESVWERVDNMLKVMGENEVRRKIGIDEYPETDFDRPPGYRQEKIAQAGSNEEPTK